MALRKNVTTSHPTVPDGAARTPLPAREGFRDITVSSTAEYVDLTAYKGRLVRIFVGPSDQGTGYYLCFVGASGAALTVTAQALSSGLMVGNIPDRVPDNYRDDFVVPNDRPFLAYRTIGAGGNGSIHVRRS